jgi:hypothetical protein
MKKSKETILKIVEELSKHKKILNVEISKHKTELLTCEVDCIQCTARMIVSRIVSKFGKFAIRSTTANTAKLGAIKIIVLRESNNE